LVHLDDPGTMEALRRHDEVVRARRRAVRAQDALARRLGEVRQAVLCCEGDGQACADPARNPRLRKAALAARACGASDDEIRDAIRGVGTQGSARPVDPPETLLVLAERAPVAAGAESAAQAAG